MSETGGSTLSPREWGGASQEGRGSHLVGPFSALLEVGAVWDGNGL